MSEHPRFSVQQRRRGRWLQLGDCRGFAIVDVAVAAPALSTPMRILHLSDLHATARWQRGFDELLALVRDDRPDVICFTGDFAEDKFDHRPALATIRRLVAGLTALAPLVAIVGNHDGDLLAHQLADLPVRLLDNAVTTIPVGRSTLELIGLAGAARFDADLVDAATLGIDAVTASNRMRVVLSHYPDRTSAIVSRFRPAVVLSGHTHGGQVCLPGARPILTHDSLARRFSAGTHGWDEHTILHVSRGLGFSGLPLRTWCSSEVTYLTLGPG